MVWNRLSFINNWRKITPYKLANAIFAAYLIWPRVNADKKA